MRPKGVNSMLHWKLKSCSRCGGDQFVDRDADGWFEQCLQCSHLSALRYSEKQLAGVGARGGKEDWSKNADN